MREHLLVATLDGDDGVTFDGDEDTMSVSIDDVANSAGGARK